MNGRQEVKGESLGNISGDVILEPRKGRGKSRKESFRLSIISIAKKDRLATKGGREIVSRLKVRIYNLYGTSHFPFNGV